MRSHAKRRFCSGFEHYDEVKMVPAAETGGGGAHAATPPVDQFRVSIPPQLALASSSASAAYVASLDWPAAANMGPLRGGTSERDGGGGGGGGYYASPTLFKSWSRSSSSQHSSPLLPANQYRRISIRTPRILSSGGGGGERGRAPLGWVGDFVRLGGARSKRSVAYFAAAVVLFFYFVTGARIWREDKSMRSFMRAGGFGLDYMGRTEDETTGVQHGGGGEDASTNGGERLPPVPVDGGLSKLCALFPWRKDCAEQLRQTRDPFQGLVYKEDRGHLFYPAVAAPDPPPSFGQPVRRATAADVEHQPHPIHYLIREGKQAWKAKVARQSKTLKEAVAEYERRYWRRPPKGFDHWFEFAKENEFVMIDEFDAMMDKVLPFLAVKPSTLAQRHEMIQFDKDFWIQVRCLVVSELPFLRLCFLLPRLTLPRSWLAGQDVHSRAQGPRRGDRAARPDEEHERPRAADARPDAQDRQVPARHEHHFHGSRRAVGDDEWRDAREASCSGSRGSR